MSRPKVVLLPGFNGSADQPILVKLSSRLEAAGFECLRLAPPRLKLVEDLDHHVAWLRDELKNERAPLVLVGRSFGGRLAIRLAAQRELKAVVLLGFPIRPPSKKRPLDELALKSLAVPALIVQGTRDELGPLPVFKPILASNSKLAIHVVQNAGHSFGSKEAGALDEAARWLQEICP